jgi:hypothetical protein
MIYDPYNGTFDNKIISSHPEMGPYQDDGLAQLSSVLLPLLPEDGYTPRIFRCGHITAWHITLENNFSQAQSKKCLNRSMTDIRRYANATLLPTGEVLISGGVGTHGDDSTAVKKEEIYSAGINWDTGQYSEAEAWRTDSSNGASSPRGYHSVALLLPDGNVLTSGSANGAFQASIEVYKPKYSSDPGLDSNRPVINGYCPPSIGYDQEFSIITPEAVLIQSLLDTSRLCNTRI